MLCCGYTLTDFPISIRLTSLALWQSNDCPSASKATLMNMDKYFMWIHYEWLHNHNKAKHNKTVCIFIGIYCISHYYMTCITASEQRGDTCQTLTWYSMMTSSNGIIFRVTGPLCGEFTGPGEFPTQRPVIRSFDVFFDLRPNKRLSKQWWGWWFETLSRSLWRHRNAISNQCFDNTEELGK